MSLLVSENGCLFSHPCFHAKLLKHQGGVPTFNLLHVVHRTDRTVGWPVPTHNTCQACGTYAHAMWWHILHCALRLRLRIVQAQVTSGCFVHFYAFIMAICHAFACCYKNCILDTCCFSFATPLTITQGPTSFMESAIQDFIEEGRWTLISSQSCESQL